jgi:hypothetical protein|tara:strand:- start:5211 stop:5474 length:264 start_codon:yes stop_codon:yes gene_type:complete
MALSPVNQELLELQTAIEVAKAEAYKEATDASLAAVVEGRRAAARLEAVRLATNTLITNRSTRPVSEREITPEEINAFAETLVQYID